MFDKQWCQDCKDLSIMLELNFNNVWVKFYPNGQIKVEGNNLPPELHSLVDWDCPVQVELGNYHYWLKEECFIIPQEA